jgi:hypothetical protein
MKKYLDISTGKIIETEEVEAEDEIQEAVKVNRAINDDEISQEEDADEYENIVQEQEKIKR